MSCLNRRTKMHKIIQKILRDYKKGFKFALANTVGVVAQLVEQRTENPCVTGSIPVDATLKA